MVGALREHELKRIVGRGPHISPTRVLPGHVDDQLTYTLIDRRPPRFRVGIGPASRYESAVPSESRVAGVTPNVSCHLERGTTLLRRASTALSAGWYWRPLNLPSQHHQRLSQREKLYYLRLL